MKLYPLLLLIYLPLALNGCVQNETMVRKDSSKDRARAMQELGASSVQRGNLSAGLDHYLKALELDPENPEIHYNLALVYRDLGQHQLALNHFQKTLSLRPDFPEAQIDVGILYTQLKEWDLAIHHFEKAANNLLYQTPDIAFNNIGLAYHYKGSYHKAIENYFKALKLYPRYADCYNNLALAHQALRNYDAAIEAYQNAIKNGPDNPVFPLNLGKLYLDLNRKKEAVDALNLVLTLDRDGPYAAEATRLLRQTGPGH